MQKVSQYASLGCAVAGIQFNNHGCRANDRANDRPNRRTDGRADKHASPQPETAGRSIRLR